jgi:hypothetical protein
LDGATDLSLWVAESVRILVLLKEAYGGDQWDHADGIRKDKGLMKVGGSANPAVQYRAAEWLLAISSSLSGAPFDVELERTYDFKNCRSVMMRSAWVNIKKAEGIAYSNAKDLDAVIERDGKFLARQIKLLEPTIVLCGGTFELVMKHLFTTAVKMPKTNFTFLSGSVKILNYRHPARASRDTCQDLFNEVAKWKN